MTHKTIQDIDWPANTRVIVRADFNVPLGPLGEVRDDFRIRQVIPTLKYLLARRCSLVIISHLGRPGGRVEPSLSLAPIVYCLRALLPKTTVRFCDDWVGDDARTASRRLRPGQVLLLENIRFCPGEDQNDPDFARQLSRWGRVLVNDCFGAAQRTTASTVGLARHLPAVAGLLVESELAMLAAVGQPPRRPVGVILGGAKVKDKIELLEAFLERADFLAVTGLLAVHFVAAQGWAVGASQLDPASVARAREILARLADWPQVELFVPVDYIVTNQSQPPVGLPVSLAGQTLGGLAPRRTTVGPDELIADIGPAAAAYIAGRIQSLATVIWNGTAGIVETLGVDPADPPPFSHGTRLLAQSLAEAQTPTVIVGGGDTVAYLDQHRPHLRERFDCISSGGGASLTYLSGRQLPAIDALWPRSKPLKLAPAAAEKK